MVGSLQVNGFLPSYLADMVSAYANMVHHPGPLLDHMTQHMLPHLQVMEAGDDARGWLAFCVATLGIMRPALQYNSYTDPSAARQQASACFLPRQGHSATRRLAAPVFRDAFLFYSINGIAQICMKPAHMLKLNEVLLERFQAVLRMHTANCSTYGCTCPCKAISPKQQQATA